MNKMQLATSADRQGGPLVPKSRRFKSLRVIMALMLRELESRDSRTSLGFLWAFIEPIATIALMSLVFGIISRVPPIGTNFPLFYMTGIIPFGIYAALSSKAAAAPKFSKQLLNFPAVRPIDAILARVFLHVFIQMVVFVVLSFSIIAYWQLNPIINPLLLIEATLMAISLGLGMGCFNAVFFMLVPTYENVWTVVTKPLMLASGVIIPVGLVPEPFAGYLWWNPVAHPVELMRAAFYPEVGTENVSVLFVVLVSLISFAFGLVMLHRVIRDALER